MEKHTREDFDKDKQEFQYQFPYHYLTQEKPFFLSRALAWGFEYQSYISFIKDEILKKVPKSVLDVGCGDGRLLSEIGRTKTPPSLTGIDYSTSSIALAKGLNHNIPITFQVIDLLEEDFNETFEMVSLIEVLEHIEPTQLTTFIHKVQNRVASGGYLLVTVPSKVMKLIPKHYQHFSIEQLTDLLVQPGFEVIESKFLNKESFMSILLQKLCSNRFYSINETRILSWWFNWYNKTHLFGEENNSRRIYLLLQKTPLR